MCMLRRLIISFLLLCLLYQQHQEVSKTELLCACYSVWLFLFSFSVYSIINIRRCVKLNYCVHVTVFDFSFTVYSIINIRWWVKLNNVCMLWCLIISFLVLCLLYQQLQKVNYCVQVTMFDYFFSLSLSTLSSTSGSE